MPFDFVAYKAKCDALSTEELQLEWQNYTRQLTSGATTTATSVLFSPLTSGISLIGLGISVPQIHNARKKRAIIGNKMLSHGAEPHTRRRDIAIPAASSVAFAALTFGIAPPIAETLGGEAGAKGIEYIISHATLDALWSIVDETRNVCQHKRAQRKLRRQKRQEKELQFSSNYTESNEELLGIAPPGPPSDNRKPRSRKIMTRMGKPDTHGGGGHQDQDERKHQHEDNSSPRFRSRPPRTVSTQRNHNQSSSHPTARQLALTHRTFSIEGPPQPIFSKLDSKSSKPWISRPVTPIRKLAARPSHSARFEEIESDQDSSSFSDQESEDEENHLETDDEKGEDVVEHILTLEEEIAILKATILRMEMEKRGLVVEDCPHAEPTLAKDLGVKEDTLVEENIVTREHYEPNIESRRDASHKPTPISTTHHDPRQQGLLSLSQLPTPNPLQTPQRVPRKQSSLASLTKKLDEERISKLIDRQSPPCQESLSADLNQQNQDIPISSCRKASLKPLRKRHDSGYFSGYQSSVSGASSPAGALYDGVQTTKSSSNTSYKILNKPSAGRERQRRSSIATDMLARKPSFPMAMSSAPVFDAGRPIYNYQKHQQQFVMADATGSPVRGNLAANMRNEHIMMRTSMQKRSLDVPPHMSSDSDEEDGTWGMPIQHQSYNRPIQAQCPPKARSWRAPD